MSNITRLMIDMDGVIYTRDELVEGTDKFIKRLLDKKLGFTFLSDKVNDPVLKPLRNYKNRV